MVGLACSARDAAERLDRSILFLLHSALLLLLLVSAKRKRKNRSTHIKGTTLQFDKLPAANYGHSAGRKKGASVRLKSETCSICTTKLPHQEIQVEANRNPL